jgi:hypothetical protein
MLRGAIDKAGVRPPKPLPCAVVAGLLFHFHVPCSLAADLRPSGTPPVSVSIERSGGRAAATPQRLRLQASGRELEFDLRRNGELLAEGAQALLVEAGTVEELPMGETWIGSAPDGAEARLTIEGDLVTGSLRLADETLVLEPSASDEDVANAHLLSPAADALAEGPSLDCRIGTGDFAAFSHEAAATPLKGSLATIGPRVLDLAVVADAAFHRRHGDASVARMLSILNQVDGIYRSDLGIAIRVVQIVVYSSEAAQPFSASSEAVSLLTEITEARRSDPLLSAHSGAAMHLMTGRSLGGPQGIAWPSSVCDPVYSTGLSLIDSKSDYVASILVAHEIAHTLGAYHDGPKGHDCADTPSGFIMWPVLGGGLSDTFSTCSRDRIAERLVTASCLDAGVPEECGNGTVDPGEECDPSAEASATCCRVDCTAALPETPCNDSGDACMEARCTAGVCVADEEPRRIDGVDAKLRVASTGMVSAARVALTVPMTAGPNDPGRAGLTLTATIGSSVLWQDSLPAWQWRRSPSGRLSFKRSTAGAGQVRAASVRFDASSGRAAIRLTLLTPLEQALPGSPTFFVLSGDPATGHCGFGEALDCIRKGGNYRCQ